ncbi:tetraacyldisaccharide 4'-kinase [Solitalea koreensis]|uniref:Tetraacyldisaccharide 4'-kinase n=1 Tax=Solitalea koreensis TaxID=543615 RepID=A0A521AHA0_9SPHI|nr:tetraacyldisaccharide 4'-kinase [Solitalea koreensis]SMO34118.1 lipid-A-disaccharide kinase [Solitalea koreensis]
MQKLRLLLYPFSLIYGLLVMLRNKLYDLGFFKSNQFDLPIIVVGNLEVGGAGKTPMIEYLVRLLADKKKVATLSRGYGRKTSGFILASKESTSSQIGDEPKQLNVKFKDISVAVSENRVKGIEQLKNDHQVILLDDAFQHRRVKAGLTVLLIDYHRVFEPWVLLPAGNLREPKSGMKRADIIVVTKAPKIFSPLDQRIIENRIRPFPGQQIYYSYINYAELELLDSNSSESWVLSAINKKTQIVLLTGIAKTGPLIDFLEQYSKNITHLEFGDHHRFTKGDIEKLSDAYSAIPGGNKLIITTEKDAMRLQEPQLQNEIINLPIHYLPIRAEICDRFKRDFDKLILDYVG